MKESDHSPLRGRVAIVTGASGGGVGSACARLLARRGAGLVVNYHSNKSGADQVCAHIIAAGGQAVAVKADVGQHEDVERLVSQALDAFRRVDVLVSNASAGHFTLGTFEDQSWDVFSKGIERRLRPAYLLTRAVLPTMRQQQSGRLIYIGSEHAEGPAAPGMIANGTSAAALVTFARYIAHEVGSYGITANDVSPSGIDTPATWRALAAAGGSAEFRERMAATVPLGRLATPDDVAGAVAFFASDDAAFMTDTVAHVNGGFGIARIAAASDARRLNS